MSALAPGPAGLTYRQIARTWWPLAASWLLMAAEAPTVSAVMARLAHPEISLAAYGGLIFPLALIIEAPIVMLLAASTALSQDWASYVRMRRFMLWTSAALTALHAAVIFTPLYYSVAQGLIGAPAEILEPGRLGLMIMLPWTASIAYRRFHQGVLIRYDQSRAVGQGTLVRFVMLGLALGAGVLADLPGVAVAAGAVIAGVVSEAVYIGWRVRPVLREQVRGMPPVEPALTLRAFLAFYFPLMMTELFILGGAPIGSAAISRMPLALESLAAWPVMSGLMFLPESIALAYNEVVVALLDRPGSAARLRRFALLLAGSVTAFVLLIAATPLAGVWYGRVSALSPELAGLARRAMWLALPVPGLVALQSWYQGLLLHSRRTRAITEAVALSTTVNVALLIVGVALSRFTGLYVGAGALTVGFAAQTAWLWWRSRAALQQHNLADHAAVPQTAAGAAD